MENKKRAFNNIVFSSIGQIITIGLGLLLPRLYIVSYGSEVNGLLNSLTQFLVYLHLFESGIGNITMQALYGPVAKKNWNDINGIMSATNVYYKRAGKWYMLALALLAVVYPFIVDSNLKYITIFCATIFSGIGYGIMFYCQGKYKLLLQAEGKNYIITNLTTITVILTNASKIGLILLGFDVVTVLAASFAISLLQVFYISWYIKTKYSELNLNVTPNYQAIEQKNYTLIHQISGMVFQNTDILILTVFCGLKIVSVYSMYKLVITNLESILTILSNGFNFILGQTFNVDRQKYLIRIDIFEMAYSIVAFSFFAVALFLFQPFIKIYTSGVNDIQYVDPALPIMFVIIALLTAMRTSMLLTINYAGHFKLTTPQTVAETIINLVTSILGVMLFGIYGVLLGTIVALLYRTNDIIIYSNRKILQRSPLKTYKIYIINILVMITLEIAFNMLFTNINSYINVAIVGAATTVISLLSFFSMQLLCMRQERQIIFSQLKLMLKKVHH